tara:strand:- start:5932 stop:7161 length:1230 start_codon:yes stop_codon:yes gene_type:complete
MRSKEFFTSEKKLSKKQKSKKEKYVKGMKKSAKDFKKRYGDDYKSVMYATATKMAKENTNESPIEQDRDNPIAKPYVDTPEWKALHDMDDKIIDAYIKHKDFKEESITEHRGLIGTYAREIATGKLVRIVDYTDDDEGIYTISYGDGKGETDVVAKDLKFMDPTAYWSDEDENLDEGVKDYLRKLAAAGIIIGSLAGIGSINDALNNSVDVVKAMNSALEIAQEQGDDEKANEIIQDIKGVKLRLDIGKDLNQVKYMQKKYAKYMPDNESSMKEGASLNPYFLTKREFDGKMQSVWEFPDGMGDEDESPYLSNFSMRDILNSLGMDPNFEDAGPMPIDKFINLTTQWLKKHINKPSGEVPTKVTKNPGGPTMIGGGKPEGWDNKLIMQFNQYARHIKQKFPKVTHIGIA